MKRLGILVENFELKPQRRSIWVWLKLYTLCGPYKVTLVQNNLDYHSHFREGAGIRLSGLERTTENEP